MNQERRLILGAGAAVGAAAFVGGAALAAPDEQKAPPASPPSGKPGDFNFLAGLWRIKHRKLKADGSWDLFDGEATCWTILGGVGSVEELRIPARDFSGMGLRMLDMETRIWSDHWVNAKSGVVTAPGQTGGFVDGVGWFISDEEDNGKPIKAAGIWDQITRTSCRWRQSTSRDGGKTWDDNWIMAWTRAT